jgi:hypothetical protein
MWHRASLRLRALTPVHIGVGLRRIVNQTRYYIPARNLWAALTSSLTLSHTHGNPQAKDFADWGKRVDDAVRFSYLFVTVKIEGQEIVYKPKYGEKKGLVWGKKEESTEQFEERFLSLAVSTAIDADRGSADEGMLFEREAIKPLIVESGNEEPVFFTGHVYLRTGQEAITAELLKKALQELTIGGDQNYGLGLLHLEKDLHFMECPGSDHPTINLNGLTVIEAHAFYRDDVEFAGDVEPLVARLWDAAKGPGRLLQSEGAFFTPGTEVSGVTTAKIVHKGYWELLCHA